MATTGRSDATTTPMRFAALVIVASEYSTIFENSVLWLELAFCDHAVSARRPYSGDKLDNPYVMPSNYSVKERDEIVSNPIRQRVGSLTVCDRYEIDPVRPCISISTEKTNIAKRCPLEPLLK